MPERRRVLIVSQLPPPVHGSAVMTIRLREALAADGHPVRVVDKRFSRSIDDVGRWQPRKLLALPSLVGRVLSSARDADVVVYFLTNRPASFLVDLLLLTVLRRWRRRVPVVLYLHTSGYSALAARGRFWARALRRSFAAAQTVVTLGPTLVADLDRLVPADRVRIIANTTPAPRPMERAADGFRLLFLSNLQPEKGAADFLALAERLLDARPDVDWRFVLAGAASREQDAALRHAIAASSAPDRFSWHGRIDAGDRDRLLADADLLVFPSTYPLEAQPLVVVEALASGLAVVGYEVGGLADLVSPEVGRLVPPGDLNGMTAAVLELQAQPDRLAAAGEAARRRYVERHHPDAYRSAWARLLQDGSMASGRDFASDWNTFRFLVAADWRANDWKSRALLLGFRLAQLAMGTPERLRARAFLPVLLYRSWTEGVLGIELRPKTRAGAGLTIHHGYALVVNDHTRIGARVVLRNGVTIGHRESGGGTPRIGDDVEIGAGAILLGDISIGAGARIGAGAVVLSDVPPGRTAVGNPARLLPEG